MLTGAAIKQAVYDGKIIISDFDERRLNPNSYNLCLGNIFKVYKEDTLYCDKYNEVEEIYVPDDEYIFIKPGKIVLGTTREWTYTPYHIPCISGRSSVARLGIEIHRTAGFGDIGFRGTWTLEISTLETVALRPGMEICQIYFEEPNGIIETMYHGKYFDQSTVTESKLYDEFK